MTPRYKLETPPLLFARYQVLTGSYVDVESHYPALTKTIAGVGFTVARKVRTTMGPGAMFHREDYKTVLLLNGQNLQLVTTDYQGSEAFSTLLVDMLGVLEDVVGTRILLRKLQLGFMDAIPFEGAFCDYLTPAVQGLDFVETDHEHRLTTYWCDLDEPGGRLDLKVASVHADNLVPDEITVLELDLDLPFEETHEQMAFVLSIEVKNDFKPPMRLEGLGAELRRYHAITSHVFAKCLTEKAKTDWNYEEL